MDSQCIRDVLHKESLSTVHVQFLLVRHPQPFFFPRQGCPAVLIDNANHMQFAIIYNRLYFAIVKKCSFPCSDFSQLAVRRLQSLLLSSTAATRLRFLYAYFFLCGIQSEFSAGSCWVVAARRDTCEPVSFQRLYCRHQATVSHKVETLLPLLLLAMCGGL